jgi:hypothetical protein
MAEILASALNIDMSGPKTYENLFKKQKEIGDEITKVEMGIADLTASRDLNAAKARQESIAKAQEKYETESGEIQKKIDSFGDVKFQPTQDNLQDMAGLFSAVGIIGAMIGGSGRNSAMNALSSMTGMLDGWKQGRADLFKQEKVKFDEELNRIKLQKDALIQKLNMVEKEYSRNKDKAEQDFQVVLAEYNSPILKEMARSGGLIRTSQYAKEIVGKSVDKAVEFNNQLNLQSNKFSQEKELESIRQANRVEIEQIKSKAKTGQGLLKPSAKAAEGYQSVNILKADLQDIRKDLNDPELAKMLNQYRAEAFATEESKILNQLITSDIPDKLQKFLVKVRDIRNNYYLDISGKAVTGGEALRNYGTVPQPGDGQKEMLNKIESMERRVDQKIKQSQQLFGFPEIASTAGTKTSLQANQMYEVPEQDSGSHYLNGREIIVRGNQWVYKDNGEVAQ